MLVNNDIPGMQVPVFLRALWLMVPIAVLLASIPLQLVPLLDQDHNERSAASTLGPMLKTPTQELGTEVKAEAAVICSLTDVVCDGENFAKVLPVPPSPRPKLAEDKVAVFTRVCEKHGLGDRCASILYAMHLVETGGDCSVIGDQGRSYGCFQIQVKMHKVAKEVATDLEKSADWTLQRMIAFGFKEGYESYSVRRHNGGGPMSFVYLAKVKAKLHIASK